LGEIRLGIMGLLSVGQLVVEKIHYIPVRHPHARIDEFIIMPDHIHLIVHLQILDENTNTGRYAPWGVSTRGVSNGVFHAPIRSVNSDKTTSNPNHHWQWKSGSLGSVINHFKGDVKKSATTIDSLFGWQANYNDSIIWDFQSYLRIKNYIQNNPKDWDENKQNGDYS
jgi:putative transposase